MGFKRLKKKELVLGYVCDGSFDKEDKSRIKKMTRIRENVEQVKNQNSTKTRIKDWFKDISEGR